MKFSAVLFLLSVSSGVLAYPIAQSGSNSLATVGSASTNATSNSDAVLDGVKTDAAAKASTSNTKVTSASVKTAVSNFATDANTVSSSINKMGSSTNQATIKSLATTAFKAESDEDAQRSVLASAAGSAGSKSNSLIVKNTPAVLKGLSAIMKDPSSATTSKNLATIQNAR